MRHAMAVVLCLSVSPGLCGTVAVSAETSSPEEVFETVWNTFDRRYALFEVKAVDWDLLHAVYRPEVTSQTSQADLFDIITSMLSHLNDTHVMVQAPPLGRDFSAGLVGSYVNELGLAGAMELLLERPLPSSYFRSEPRAAGDGRFQYGWVAEDIGYVQFGEFKDPGSSAAAVDAILQDLQGARALIVDIRRNAGGDDRVGKVIADRFADRRRLYMVTRERSGPEHGDFSDPRYWEVNPADRVFTGPVIVLTSRLSVSAAENFALAMRVLPHVTVVGDFTSGCFADMQWFDLPNGWRFSVSRNLFTDYAGRCWEGIGVPPDIMVRTDHTNGEVDPEMDLALRLLQGAGPAPQDESASAAAARTSLVEVLAADLGTMGFDRARQAFDRNRTEMAPERWYVSAKDLNSLGYRLIASKQLEQAVGVFELYVELFPTDANSHDSLGEAYMVNGDTGKAIASYQRSIDLNPDNQNAKKMLARLKE